MGRLTQPLEFDRRFWVGIRAGLSVEAAAVGAGTSVTSARRAFRKACGVNATRLAEPAGRYLSWSEREEIAALDKAGHGVREVARRLGRNPGYADPAWTVALLEDAVVLLRERAERLRRAGVRLHTPTEVRQIR